MIKFGNFKSVTVGTTSKGGCVNAPSLKFTHVSNTRRWYINRLLAEKLGIELKENDNIFFQLKIGEDEEGNSKILLCKDFGDYTMASRGSVKGGKIVFYSTPLGDWVERIIGEVEINKTVSFSDIEFDISSDDAVAIINISENSSTPFSARYNNEEETNEDDDFSDDSDIEGFEEDESEDDAEDEENYFEDEDSEELEDEEEDEESLEDDEEEVLYEEWEVEDDDSEIDDEDENEDEE